MWGGMGFILAIILIFGWRYLEPLIAHPRLRAQAIVGSADEEQLRFSSSPRPLPLNAAFGAKDPP